MHATHMQRTAQQQMSVPRVFMLEQSSPWARIGGSVIHPRLAALGAPSEVRGPSGIVNTSWDRLPAFCMWDLLFCVLCRCRTFYSCTVDCRPPTLSPASAPPCHLRAMAALIGLRRCCSRRGQRARAHTVCDASQRSGGACPFAPSDRRARCEDTRRTDTAGRVKARRGFPKQVLRRVRSSKVLTEMRDSTSSTRSGQTRATKVSPAAARHDARSLGTVG